MRVLLEFLLTLLRPPIDLGIWIWMKRGLITLNLFAICMLLIRFGVTEHAEHSPESDMDGRMGWFISGVVLICFVSVSQSFLQFKLSQLVYILPENYKWSMVAAQASGGIVTAVFASFLQALLALGSNESDAWLNVSTLCYFICLIVLIVSSIGSWKAL